MKDPADGGRENRSRCTKPQQLILPSRDAAPAGLPFRGGEEGGSGVGGGWGVRMEVGGAEGGLNLNAPRWGESGEV